MLSFLSTFPMSTERQKNTLLLNNPDFFCMISQWALSPRFLEIINYTTFPGLQGQWSTVLLQEDQKSAEEFSKEASCKYSLRTKVKCSQGPLEPSMGLHWTLHYDHALFEDESFHF